MFIVRHRSLAVIATLSFALSFALWGRLSADSPAAPASNPDALATAPVAATPTPAGMQPRAPTPTPEARTAAGRRPAVVPLARH
jgi:hypothetical protein